MLICGVCILLSPIPLNLDDVMLNPVAVVDCLFRQKPNKQNLNKRKNLAYNAPV